MLAQWLRTVDTLSSQQIHEVKQLLNIHSVEHLNLSFSYQSYLVWSGRSIALALFSTTKWVTAPHFIQTQNKNASTRFS